MRVGYPGEGKSREAGKRQGTLCCSSSKAHAHSCLACAQTLCPATRLPRRLCPNSTGADIRSVCTEAGMYAIRARRKTVTEKDFLDAVNKVRAHPCPAPPSLRLLPCMRACGSGGPGLACLQHAGGWARMHALCCGAACLLPSAWSGLRGNALEGVGGRNAGAGGVADG